MKAFHLLLAVPVASLALMTAIPAAQQPASAPVAKKVPRETKIHGYTLKDDYFWLRDKANAEVTTYLEADTDLMAADVRGEIAATGTGDSHE